MLPRWSSRARRYAGDRRRTITSEGIARRISQQFTMGPMQTTENPTIIEARPSTATS